MTLDVPSVKWAVITAPTDAKQCSWQPTLNQGEDVVQTPAWSWGDY